MSKILNARSRFVGGDPGTSGPVTWLLVGRFGGMPRPGRSGAGIEADLEAVKDLGLSMVVTLTREWTPPEGLFEAFGLKNIHVPIPDWQPPTLQQAEGVCETVLAELAGGGSVVFHCQAGRGRTGTMLAAMLIWDRPDAEAAIDRVKSTNPDWIETASQIQFLTDFAAVRRARTDGRDRRSSNRPGDGAEQGKVGIDVAR